MYVEFLIIWSRFSFNNCIHVVSVFLNPAAGDRFPRMTVNCSTCFPLKKYKKVYGIVRDRFQLHCILSHQLLLNNLYYYMIDKSLALWFAYMEQFRSKRRFMKLNVNITFLFFSLHWIKISWGISKTQRLVIIIHAVQSNIACLKFLGYDFKIIGLHL